MATRMHRVKLGIALSQIHRGNVDDFTGGRQNLMHS